jgi:hypothetical protein
MIVAARKVIRPSAEAEALRPDVEVPEGKTAIPCEATDSRLSAKAVGKPCADRITPARGEGA